MRTDLAQYYHSKKPSVRLQYMTSMDEKVNFEMEGTEMLSRELNVFVSTRVNHRQLMEQIRGLAMSNNTSGASIYDLGNIVKADSLSEIDHILKGIEQKTERARQEEMQAQQQAVQAQQEGESQRQQADLAFKAEQAQLERNKDVQVAEIRAAGYTAMNDRDENQRNDYIDTLEYLDKKNARDKDISLTQEKETNRRVEKQQDNQIKREELETRKKIADTQLQVAKTNKNKYDVKGGDKKEK
jgi:hypothetical protein